jgi:hypothetical protein
MSYYFNHISSYCAAFSKSWLCKSLWIVKYLSYQLSDKLFFLRENDQNVVQDEDCDNENHQPWIEDLHELNTEYGCAILYLDSRKLD